MQPIPFIAESAADAVTQIRASLGPDAVVVNIRPLPARGVSRFWRKTRFEVMAHRPEAAGTRLDLTSDAPAAPGLDERPSSRLPSPQVAAAVADECDPPLASRPVVSEIRSGGWRIGPILERSGFLPASAQRVVDQLRQRHGEAPPASVADELAWTRGALKELWRQPRPLAEEPSSPHVLIGPAGAGKTTVLCKWLAQTVLVEDRPALVWRLDGATANASESLSVYCEVLGVPVERRWAGPNGATAKEKQFVDLPGVDWRDAGAVAALGVQLREIASPHVHLVLNGAYDVSLLLAQVRAFSVLPVTDLIVTHLDEESRWGKLWNLLLGTKFTLRFLSAGQNIPGDFVKASPERILLRQFPPVNTGVS